MTNCDYCDDELFDDYDSIYHMRSGDAVRLCDSCKEKFDNEDGVSGKFVAERCKSCGHLRGIKFVRYKPRGRPKGSRTDPMKLAERRGIRPLDQLVEVSAREAS